MSRFPSSPLAALRDILIGSIVEGEHDPIPPAIGYGLSLAEAAGAHVTIQSASWCLVGSDAWLQGTTDEGIGVIDRRLDALARAFAEKAAGAAAQAGLVCTWEAPSLPYPEVVHRLAAEARLHDLTVLDLDPVTEVLSRETIETTLLASGRPVLAVPRAYQAFAGRRILVAWDGSLQAARAANEAMPLLRAAEAVDIVSVGDAEDLLTTVPGAEFARHLARHGVAVTVSDLPQAGSIADTLRTHAGVVRADLIVMGAYRHSRTQEFLFGGATRSLLKNPPVPLFLAH
ncbi:universal stress protein [Methylobacterium currus]|uniref:Universal stress protein n=1 Tax=Methylobacterium currus TaxID=2051553 RepID=A0A2R4WPC5_9HYPH|nr:universal stress protein [Methylobacterium currus]AWB23402.1 universal stress protein [Methylobacterium currus]UHC16957.1 universal stress protein [Methylobacterium currus]